MQSHWTELASKFKSNLLPSTYLLLLAISQNYFTIQLSQKVKPEMQHTKPITYIYVMMRVSMRIEFMVFESEGKEIIMSVNVPLSNLFVFNT
ncbi:hypothetical protein HI914_00098 [Erysiphe necator]|nr:hypothetical protein HI914_00098 [Erysiphe necator]